MKLMVFDVGGTEIKYCVMGDDLQCHFSGAEPTPLDTQEHFFAVIKEIFDRVKEEAPDLEGVAMSLPGFIDSEKGKNNGGGFMKYNQGKSIGPELSEILGVPVYLANDGKCAAYAEFSVGALQGTTNSAVYICGTGVGGGLIIDGKLMTGPHYTAGEYSFMRSGYDDWQNLDHSIGFMGGSRGLLIRYFREAGLPEDTKMNGRELFERINSGDALANKVLDDYAEYVAKAIFNLNALLDLEKVAIGGGISKQPILLERIRVKLTELFESNVFDVLLPRPEIVACQYGNDANLIGAYMFYKENR
jgi:predicted NBD/HSP70 family sugar kinase